MASCLFQHFGPDNIILFVKSCFQFHQNRNLFAIFRRLRQRCNDRRMSTNSIQSLFDCKYTRIFCCLPYKIHNRIKAHIWMMQKYISFSDHLENIFIILKFRNRSRCIFRTLVFIKALHSVNLHQHSQIQRTRNIINVCILNLKLFFKNTQKTFIHLFFRFQANHFTPLTLFQLFLDLNQQIFCFILVNRQICISHNSVWMRTDYIITQKQLTNIVLNDLFQKDHGSLTVLFRRDLYDSRQHRRYLDCCKFQFFGMLFVTFLGDQRTDIQCLVADQWEWSGRIHCHRCQHRIYVIFKIAIHEFCLFHCQVFMFCYKMKAHFFQCRKYRTVKRAVLHTYKLMCLAADFLQLFLRRHACNVFFLIACMYLIFQ